MRLNAIVQPLRFGKPMLLFALAVVAVSGGCDSISTPAAPAACLELGSQCQLPEGPLGVCEQTKCEAGRTPPCFKCTSQH